MALLTDAEISKLISESKPFIPGLSPLLRPVERNSHRRKEFEFIGLDGSPFQLMTRQNTINQLDFSVILGYQLPGVNRIFRLRRYNGKSHYHSNALEKGPLFRDFHMHTATERYQRAPGFKEDHFATIDKRYYDFESAVTCMLGDCGFRSPIEDAPLFSGVIQ